MAVPLPVSLEERIRAAHREGAQLLQRAGLPVELVDVALAVERHRWAWKPDNVRVALIAESHVYTSAHDVALRVRIDRLPPAARHAPSQYVRLIYCLGYGESTLLSGVPADRNGGTPQFWSIFARPAGTGAPRPIGIAATDDRVAWKIRNLTALRAKGVWLLDAALNAMYAPKGDRVPGRLQREIHAVWWRHYGRYVVAEMPTAQLWAVGKSVYKVLKPLGVPLCDWIYQPQAARAGPKVDMERGWSALQRAVAEGL